MFFLLLIVVGLFAGILAGMLGVGGGLIFTPVLFFLFKGAGVAEPVLWTIASSLFCTFVASSTSVYRQFRMRNLFIKEGFLVGFMGILGTIFGRQIITQPFYSEREFSLIFSTLLIYTAYKFLKGTKNPTQTNLSDDGQLTLNKTLLIGILGGFIATIAGVGGGIVMVPLMTLLFALPFLKGVSISSTAIVIISFSAFFQLALLSPTSLGISAYSVGYIDFGTVFPLLLGTIIGANIGVLLTKKINRRVFEITFSLMAIAVAIRMLWGVFF